MPKKMNIFLFNFQTCYTSSLISPLIIKPVWSKQRGPKLYKTRCLSTNQVQPYSVSVVQWVLDDENPGDQFSFPSPHWPTVSVSHPKPLTGLYGLSSNCSVWMEVWVGWGYPLQNRSPTSAPIPIHTDEKVSPDRGQNNHHLLTVTYHTISAFHTSSLHSTVFPVRLSCPEA